MSNALRAEKLTKVYGQGPAAVRALDGVDVQFEAGRFTAVVGRSGSGKSTLLYCLAGLERPDVGAVHLEDRDLTKLRERDLTRVRRERIGFVFQAFNLLPMLTARENVLLPLRIAGLRQDRAWTDRIVDALHIRDRLDHRPHALSGGQQQRVAVARALVTRPAVVLADEPTGNLDSESGRDLITFLRRSVDELGQTVVMVTHDPAAQAYADRVVRIEDGRVIA